MATVVHLSRGTAVQAPAGAVRIMLTASASANLVVTRESGQSVEPLFRNSATDAVYAPGEAMQIAAQSADGGPFREGTRVGVSFSSPGGAGQEVVRPTAEVGGQSIVTLVTMTAEGLLSDALAEAHAGGGDSFAGRAWLRGGSFAYRRNHATSSTKQRAWGLALDASASVLVQDRRPALGRAIETIIGIVASACNTSPKSAVTAAEPVVDAVSYLQAEVIDWDQALGHRPAPWPRVTPAVEEAARGAELVVVLLDGVPVDYRELTAWAKQSSVELLVVAVAVSRYGTLPLNRPSQPWQEELAALNELSALPNVTVASVAHLDEAVDEPAALADALFPQVRTS